jgi:hypothetical protein
MIEASTAHRRLCRKKAGGHPPVAENFRFLPVLRGLTGSGGEPERQRWVGEQQKN